MPAFFGARADLMRSLPPSILAGFTTIDFTSGSLPSGVTASGGSGTVVNSSGTIVAASSPKFDYTSGAAAFAAEEAATNYALQSGSLQTSPWVGHNQTLALPVTSANAGTAPDGTNAAFQIAFLDNQADGQSQNWQQLLTGLTPGKRYLLSMWAKLVSGSGTQYLAVQDNSSANGYAFTGNKRVTVGPTWKRIFVPFTPSVPGSYIAFGNDTAAAGRTGGIGWTKAGTFLLWGAQVEVANANNVPTSYIPTTTTVAARTADAVYFTQPSGAVAYSVLFDDGSSQVVDQTPGTATLTPANLRRRRIKTITPLASISSRPITGVSFGSIWRYSASKNAQQGDTYQNTIGSDGAIYAMTCDTRNWDDADTANSAGSATQSHNVMLGKLSAFDTTVSGSKVNGMKQFGYMTQTDAGDAAGWKSSGLISVSGTLYMFLGRNVYYRQSTGRQDVLTGHIFKSTDLGVTITPQPPGVASPLASPMFNAPKFSNGAFVMMGRQDYLGNTAHRTDQYVYAISNDGAWNNGNTMVIGRCLITDMAAQDASKWSFYQGGDGMLDTSWGALSSAATILSGAKSMSLANVQYHPYCNRYSMMQWTYPRLRDEGAPASVTTTHTTVTEQNLYESPTPWGPWTLVQADEWTADGFYNPAIIEKSVGMDGGKTVVVAATGDYFRPTTEYTFTEIPAVFAN